MLGLDDLTGKMVVVQPACGMWSCPACAKVLAKRWILRTILMVDQSEHPDRFDFVTLTMHEKLETQEATVVVFEDAWRKLYAALKRTKQRFSYVLVPELHKDNRLHIHMVTDFDPPDTYFVHRKKKRNTEVKRMRNPELMDKFWKDVPRAYGFGFANDQEHMRGDTTRVAAYVAKYLAKQRKVNQWAKGFKHVRASHDVPDVPAQENALEGFQWAVMPTLVELQIAINAAQGQGYKLVNSHTGELL